jgi:hypothetical protein
MQVATARTIKWFTASSGSAASAGKMGEISLLRLPPRDVTISVRQLPNAMRPWKAGKKEQAGGNPWRNRTPGKDLSAMVIEAAIATRLLSTQ